MPRRSNFCQFSLRFTLLLSVSFRGPSWASIAFIYTTPGRPGNEFVRHITLKFYAHFTSLVYFACPWTSDDAPVLKWERRERINIRVISGKEQDRNESEIEEGEDDSFVMHLSAAIPGGDPGEPPVICTTTSTNSHYPKPNLCNLIQDGNDINLDWTYRKDALMNAVSDFIPTKKGKTPRLGSQVKSSTLRGKRRLLALSWRNLLLTINNRTIANCVQRLRLLYLRAVRCISAHLTQISRGSLNALVLF